MKLSEPKKQIDANLWSSQFDIDIPAQKYEPKNLETTDLFTLPDNVKKAMKARLGMSNPIDEMCGCCAKYPLCRQDNPSFECEGGFIQHAFDSPHLEWAECLCDEIDPSDRPCIVCEALDSITAEMRGEDEE